MGQFSVRGIEAWILKRVIDGLNRVQTASELSAMVKDHPNHGQSGYDIGEKVAQRILDRRNELPGDRFSSIGQLKGIFGLGEDKFQDLVYTYGIPAAELFRQEMYESVIKSNWVLEFQRVKFEDQDEFLALVDDPAAFSEWIKFQVAELSESRIGHCRALETVEQELAKSYPQAYMSGHLGAYAFALWFYRFDYDNWFSFETVRKATDHYLDYFTNPFERIELRMHYGFENKGLLAQPVTVSGLPVVVNYAENCITIWSAQLND